MTRKSRPHRIIALIGCWGLLFLASSLLHPTSISAQFIGYVTPQTVTQTLAPAGTACTGSSQQFTTANLGQTQHYATITPVGVELMQVGILGQDGAGNTTIMSDTIQPAFTSNGSATVAGSGYFPKTIVSVVCTGGTFTLSYSGTSATSNLSAGAYLTALQVKTLFGVGASQGTTASVPGAITPFGSSQGKLFFRYLGGAVTGSTFTLNCASSGATVGVSVSWTFTLAAVLTYQIFPVPVSECPLFTGLYTSGGASANNFTLDYIFDPPGTPAASPVTSSAISQTCATGGNFSSCSPTQLGVNAITEPAAGTSALSNIIDTRGAKEATLHYNCTAGTISVNVQTYAEDGTTTLALVTPVTATAAATNAMLLLGSEVNPTVNTGTLSATAILRLPARALAFSFSNTGGAGTCTARLYLSY